MRVLFAFLVSGVTLSAASNGDPVSKYGRIFTLTCSNSPTRIATELLDLYEGRLRNNFTFPKDEVPVERLLNGAMAQLARIDSKRARSYETRSLALLNQFNTIETFEKSNPRLRIVGEILPAIVFPLPLPKACKFTPSTEGPAPGLNLDYVPKNWSQQLNIYRAALILHLTIQESESSLLEPKIRFITALLLSSEAATMTDGELGINLGLALTP